MENKQRILFSSLVAFFQSLELLPNLTFLSASVSLLALLHLCHFEDSPFYKCLSHYQSIDYKVFDKFCSNMTSTSILTSTSNWKRRENSNILNLLKLFLARKFKCDLKNIKIILLFWRNILRRGFLMLFWRKNSIILTLFLARNSSNLKNT